MSGGRDCVLYRMRVRHLLALARRLEDVGYAAVVIQPSGLPVLRIRGSGVGDLDIIATVGHDWRDWLQYRRAGGVIAPVTEVDEAARMVLARLRDSHGEFRPRVGVGS